MNDRNITPERSDRDPAAEIERAVRDCLARYYGIDGDLDRLPGENLNLLVTQSGIKKYVLKIVDEAMPSSVVDLEFAAVMHARERGFEPKIPKTVQNIYKQLETGIELPIKGKFRLRIIEFIDGSNLFELTDISANMLENLGRTVACFARVMEDFEHPAAHRKHRWNLAETLQHEPKLSLIEAPARRELLEWAFGTFRAARQHLDGLPWQFIHGDAHDENILVEGDRVVGLIDFGDCCRNPTVADLAICLAYLMMRGDEPLAIARAILRGYRSARALSHAELGLIYPLICGRLAASLCIANARKRIDPLNPNWFGGEERTWRWLASLRDYSTAEFARGIGG